jgi:hypothetical protein
MIIMIIILEIQCMWNVKKKLIPVIRGATGTIWKPQRLPEQHTGKARNQGTTKKKVILGTAHKLRKVLM